MPIAHDKLHGSGIVRDELGRYYYTHGAFLGHVLPGSLFVLLGLWWLLTAFQHHLRATSKKNFASRAWYHWPWAPKRLQTLPLEPIAKVVGPLIGILGELWLGHDSFRRLYRDDGSFLVDNINDWQHSAMYSAFLLSGVVDLLGHCLDLPPGTEHAFLALAFIVEGILLGFHLKGPEVEVIVHLILVMTIAAAAVAILTEMVRPHSVLVAGIRGMVVTLQGVWWIQIGFVLFKSNPAWDPEGADGMYMGAAMMAPVLFCVHLLWISFATFALYLILRAANGSTVLVSPRGFEKVSNDEEADHPTYHLNGHSTLQLGVLSSRKDVI